VVVAVVADLPEHLQGILVDQVVEQRPEQALGVQIIVEVREFLVKEILEDLDLDQQLLVAVVVVPAELVEMVQVLVEQMVELVSNSHQHLETQHQHQVQQVVV
jgi:hypothetical protein